MIGLGSVAELAQSTARAFHVLASDAVDDAGLAFVTLQHALNLSNGIRPTFDALVQIRAIERTNQQ